ncbi:MAG: hypothetical protein WEB58_03920 [Planctomycetaceae bacterium]
MQTYEIFRRCLFLTMAVYLATVVVQADDEKKNEAKPATMEVKIKDLELIVPKSWEKQEPTSKIATAQFGIPAAKDDETGAVLVISVIKGGGGGVDMNIPRWLGEFSGEGRSIKVKTAKAEQGEYAIVDLQGTHIGSTFARRQVPLEDARMLVVVMVNNDEGYFLKLTGSKKTVDEAEEAFRASFGGDAEAEKDYEF